MSAGDELMKAAEMFGQVAAVVGGYKVQLQMGGISADAADEMAVDFHRALIKKILNTDDQPASTT